MELDALVAYDKRFLVGYPCAQNPSRGSFVRGLKSGSRLP